MLSLLILLPLIFAIFAYFIEEGAVKITACLFSFIVLILNCYLMCNAINEFNLTLIKSFNFGINLKANSISFVLALIANFMLFVSLCFFKEQKRDFLISAMILSACMNGLFLANDALLFYIFWEVSLLPLLYLMAINGSIDLARRFFIFAFLGSIFMLLAIIFLAYNARLDDGILNFNISDFSTSNLSFAQNTCLFLCFFLAFAIKAPIFPFHSWAIKTYSQAPNFVSVMLASFKMAPFGFLKFLVVLFPEQIESFSFVLMLLCAISAIYAAILASSASSFKELCALSSISHIGILSIGIFSNHPLALSGAVFYMLAHALVSGAMFLYAQILEDNYKTYNLNNLKGLAKAMPFATFLFGVLLFASISLPLTINFVGEFLVLYGVFAKSTLVGVLATLIVILGAIYMLVMFKNVFLSKSDEAKSIKIDKIKLCVLSLIAFMVLYYGINPSVFLDYIKLGL